MNDIKKERKGEIKYLVSLDEEQKEAKRLILGNQIVLITGRAGSGKSLVGAQTALDLLFKKEYFKVYVTRPTIEVGVSLGFLPGDLNAKITPYNQGLIENLEKCYKKEVIDKLIEEKKIDTYPIQFIRSKTMDQVLIIEEAQNMSKHEMLAVLTRLGKNGKIIVNGDNEQQDINILGVNGVQYLISLSKKIEEIKWIKLKNNHRSDLVGKILDMEYGA